MGGLSLCSGEFVASRSYLEKARDIYDPAMRDAFIEMLGIDAHVMALMFLSLTLFFLGYPDQALARRRDVIAEARHSNHRPSLVIALSTTTRLLSCLGDHRMLAESADELVALSAEQGFPYWLPQGTMYQGWLKAGNGDVEGGLAQLREGKAAFRATGAELWMPLFSALEADAQKLLGDVDGALTTLQDALRMARTRGENWFEVELLRHEGEFRRHCNPEAAEALFGEAIGIACRQHAKLWELRATVSLAQLLRDQGRRAEARDLLAAGYGWFTEGFATPDLKAAKALLDELA